MGDRPDGWAGVENAADRRLGANNRPRNLLTGQFVAALARDIGQVDELLPRLLVLLAGLFGGVQPPNRSRAMASVAFLD